MSQTVAAGDARRSDPHSLLGALGDNGAESAAHWPGSCAIDSSVPGAPAGQLTRTLPPAVRATVGLDVDTKEPSRRSSNPSGDPAPSPGSKRRASKTPGVAREMSTW